MAMQANLANFVFKKPEEIETIWKLVGKREFIRR
jgi:hypothetical protein